MKRPTDIAYIAGLFDGEGCVSVRKWTTKKAFQHTLYVSITNTDKKVLDWIQSQYGGGLCLARKRGDGRCSMNCYCWSLSSGKA